MRTSGAPVYFRQRRRTVKKTICALCSLLLCVLCICPSFAAQGAYTLTLQTSGSAAVGEPLTVSLLLSVPEGETLEHYAVATQISYDAAVLRLENTAAHEDLTAIDGGAVRGSTRRLVNLNNSSLVMEGTWDNPAVLLTMTFVPLAAQDTEITVYRHGIGAASGGDAEVTVHDLAIHLAPDAEPEFDLNNDGVTDIFDLQFLYDYLSGCLTDEGDIHDRADCNGDGSVDILDYQQLYQLLTAPQEG